MAVYLSDKKCQNNTKVTETVTAARCPCPGLGRARRQPRRRPRDSSRSTTRRDVDAAHPTDLAHRSQTVHEFIAESLVVPLAMIVFGMGRRAHDLTRRDARSITKSV